MSKLISLGVWVKDGTQYASASTQAYNSDTIAIVSRCCYTETDTQNKTLCFPTRPKHTHTHTQQQTGIRLAAQRGLQTAEQH